MGNEIFRNHLLLIIYNIKLYKSISLKKNCYGKIINSRLTIQKNVQILDLYYVYT